VKQVQNGMKKINEHRKGFQELFIFSSFVLTGDISTSQQRAPNATAARW